MYYSEIDGGIEIRLPITTPTGKVRVKRPHQGRASNPVACCSEPVAAEDYLEWQISYDTADLHDPSAMRGVVLTKPTGIRYGCELVRLMEGARKLGLVLPGEWEKLRGLAAEDAMRRVEEREQIVMTRRMTDAAFENRFAFARFSHEVPVYLKSHPQYAVEMKIAPRQRAIGTQAMIFVHLPVGACKADGDPLVGRKAYSKETVTYRITAANAGVVTDATMAFLLASKNHARDIRQIFDALGI